MEQLLEVDPGTEQQRRWKAVDRLLPAPTTASGDGAPPLLARDQADQVVGVGVVQRDRLQADDMRLTYMATDQFRLHAVVGGTDPHAALDDLLGQWSATLRQTDDIADDSAAVVFWPSRDAQVQRALVSHGLAPLTGVGVRPTRSSPPPDAGAGAPEEAGVRIRFATPHDADAVHALRMDEVRWSTHFGLTTVRACTEQRIREEVEFDLAAQDPWSWVAERDGAIVGALTISPPPRSAWISWMVDVAPTAYVSCLSVRAGRRGTGVGRLLAAAGHRKLDETGIVALLGIYNLANPLSVPFWSRLGFRPIWTMWEVRPATALR